MNWQPSRREVGLILCLLFLNAIALFPLLTTGYLGDDIRDSQIRGKMLQMHSSLWGVVTHDLGGWIKNDGRFFPLSFYQYFIFYAVRNIFLFKLFVLTIVLASLAALFVFLRRLTGSTIIPGVCLFLLPLVVQFRAVWDPILGFCAQYPLITFLLFFSLTLFLTFVDMGDHRALAIAIVLFVCCELIFETSYLLCLLYVVVAYARRRKWGTALVASWPFLAATAGLTAISLVLKKLALGVTQTYKPNFDPASVARAYAVQTFGAVPFSYYWLDPYHVFSSQVSRWPAPVHQGLPLLLALALLTILLLRNSFSGEMAPTPQVRTIDVVAIGVLLFALPQSFISLSPVYQKLLWGTVHLAVHISCLGLTLLLTLLVVHIYQRTSLSNRWRNLSIGVSLAVWTLLFAINLQHNWLVAIAENDLFWYPRVLTEEALQRGLLANINPQSILLVSGASLWDNPNEYSGRTGRLFSVYRLAESPDIVPAFQAAGAVCRVAAVTQDCSFRPDSRVYTVQIRHLANGNGAVLLARVRQSYQVDGMVRGLLADEVIAYFRFPRSSPELRGSISGYLLPSEGGNLSLFRAGPDRLGILQKGRGWEMTSFRSGAMFDALSLQGDISPPVSFSAIWMAKPAALLELHPPGPELLHIGFEGQLPESGAQRPPITFIHEMSIDVLLTPASKQVPYADILSNHASDFRGIAIEQRGDQTNHYSMALGSGKEWMNAGDFSLQPARRNYISLQVNDRETSLYVDGDLVARKTLTAPIASSERPVIVGNWIGGGRQFNGLIDEVLIAKGIRSGDEVHADWLRRLRNANMKPGGN